MRFCLTLPNLGVGDDPNTLVDLAVEAESAGWDGVFVWDVPLPYPGTDPEGQKMHEAWMLLAAMAVRTQRVMLGTMITPIAWRQPWMIAKQASTLQAMSGGRFVLSVGLGAPPEGGPYFYEEEDRRTRAAMVDEALHILEVLWSGEPLRHDGRHFRVRGEPSMKPVVDPRPTVWVVGAWNHDPDAWPRKRSLRRALHWDGILPQFFRGDKLVMGFEPDAVRALTEDIARERSEPCDVIV
jgi:alkanesulfonate monooxygenase SsuD/methylene tetrahydromethanopterin reductase-like flavin-dependent oxidoreductase (luciferase family)